jgi:hypothetical protein
MAELHRKYPKSKASALGWAPVAYACNPSYLGGRSGGFPIQSQPRQILRETLSQKNPSQKSVRLAVTNFFFFSLLGNELRASHKLSKHLYQ